MLHKHRIIPGHMGGTYEESNVVLLTIEQHANAHKVLWETHGCWQDRLAWLALSGTVGKDEIIFTKLSEAGKKGGKTNSGRKLTPEHRQKIGQISANRVWTDESRKRISDALKGHKISEETKRKISKSLTGKPTGRILTQNQKDAMTAGRVGKPHPISEEALKRRLGRKRSPETRQRMCAAQQLAAQNRKQNEVTNG